MEPLTREITQRDRFQFGRNWGRFLEVLDEARIDAAMESIRRLTGYENLVGKTFLDVGSGSGLFSLAARKMGANVHSFDFDPESVKCTGELRRQYFDRDALWKVEHGSVLDKAYIDTIGAFDVVYAWGVLHHTGAMWKALENVTHSVKPGGTMIVAIYNDQGGASRRWHALKRFYNKSPDTIKRVLEICIYSFFGVRDTLIRLARLENPFGGYWSNRRNDRGMDAWVDCVDWVGGFPFEVAKPEDIFEFYKARGFSLIHLKTCGGGLGCNEFVFKQHD